MRSLLESALTATDDLPASLAELLRQRAPGRIATTGIGNLPHDLAVRLIDLVGKDAVPFDDAVNEVTAPKTDEEIENARKAVAIAEQAHEHMLAFGHVGMRECDLAVEMNLFARELGATHVVDGSAGDVAAQVQGLTGGGADFAFDTTGKVQVMTNALASLRLGGHAGFVGVQSENLTLDPLAIVGKTISGILEGGADPHVVIPELIQLWRDGKFPFDRLIETFPLDAINEAEQASLTGQVVKPVLLP